MATTKNVDGPSMIDRSFLQTRLSQTEAVLADLRQRRAVLDKQIAAYEEVGRTEREMLHNLDNHATSPLPQQATPAQRPSDKIITPSFGDAFARKGSKKYRILMGVADFLADGRERHRNEITEHLIRRGIVPGGERAFPQVSNYLCVAKEHFVSTRHGYWTLKQQTRAAE
jgi:hypothetical protein